MANPSTPARRKPSISTRGLNARPSPVAPAATATTRPTQKPASVNSGFMTRRLGLRAAGVAVIVIAGTVLGSQLKTRQQAQERSQKQQAVEHEQSDEGQSRQTIAKPTPESQSVPAESSVTSRADIQRQIAFLEERRGGLMTQKFNLEKKLERVREKKRKEEETESRRAASGIQDR